MQAEGVKMSPQIPNLPLLSASFTTFGTGEAPDSHLWTVRGSRNTTVLAHARTLNPLASIARRTRSESVIGLDLCQQEKERQERHVKHSGAVDEAVGGGHEERSTSAS